MIKDSGNRREFETGAVRDCRAGVGRCDLLPLDVISYFLPDENVIPILRSINKYIRTGTICSLYNALDAFLMNAYTDNPTGLLEVAKHYEEGAKKYDDRNWEKGIPLHCFIDSAVRHYLKHLRGDIDEQHDRAFVWNMLGAIWTHKNKPEMIDLPFKEVIDNG